MVLCNAGLFLNLSGRLGSRLMNTPEHFTPAHVVPLSNCFGNKYVPDACRVHGVGKDSKHTVSVKSFKVTAL
jgi:hypothetical protein